MAFGFTSLLNALKAQFGENNQRIASGADVGDVSDHVNRLAQKPASYDIDSAQTTQTQPITARVCFVADEEADVVSIQVVCQASVTVSNTDRFLLTFLKRKSPTWSVTESIGTITSQSGGAAGTWINNGAHKVNNVLLATTTTVLDLDPGDVITVAKTSNGLGAILPITRIKTVVREKG